MFTKRRVAAKKKLKRERKKKKTQRLTEKCANIFFQGDSLIGNFKNAYQPRNTVGGGLGVGFTWEAVWRDQKPSMLTTVV